MDNAISDGISQVENPAERSMCGYGFIVLSKDMTRADYVEKSLRNSVITIITDRGEIIKDCFVNEDVWQYLKFPKTKTSKGSCVLWVCPPNSNKTTVLGTITKRDELQKIQAENSFKLSRGTDESNVSIEGVGDSGNLNIVVDGDVEGGAQISVRLLNSLTEAVFDLYVQGNLNIEVDDSVTIKIKNALNVRFIDEFNNSKFTDISYVLGVGYELADEFGNNIKVNEEGVHVKVTSGKKINLEGANTLQNAVLGEDLVSTLKDLISEINKITIPSLGAGTPMNKLDFLLLSIQLGSILSKINYIS